ncbi:peptidase G2 autoproteolytic cleavage domain-containing protein [Staphylococcus sp. NRL 16/872]|uniref:peptidase G2 autoproteolytic cleavage domain-containing protein n=1 Tax=Staphylococcus sp. NRL 16/872 TaxID=2930131 RepID=UPI001FB4EC1E|nr:peptidase G2 autoproteolytic cleavage domain-containing protein [Staphylococcus sp. NRL 16/872]WEN70359.1 peptidase G2 autoproteolytic cleavage domain-containing protein [Staphylococcus sp. NRL 16/872]
MIKDIVTKLHSYFGEKFINQVESNFENITSWSNNVEDNIKAHKTSDKVAHNSSQITYADTTVSEFLTYLKGQQSALVLGHNGDGVAELKASRTAIDGTNHDVLSDRLFYDFNKTKNDMDKLRDEFTTKLRRNVHVDDFGGDPTGKNDSTKAFEQALGNGNVTVNMSAGAYIVTGIKIPNNTRLIGQGKDITTIKLANNTPAENCGITNLKTSGNAENISIENFTFDGNKFRQGGGLKPSGGSRSSNIRFAGVKGGFIYNVKSHHSLLHGIDVTFASDDYYYQGDGNRVPQSLESQFVHIDKCEVHDFGDDGITTHHSRNITISNCYAHHPTISGGNNNGIEIDDGSQQIYLSDNKTERNFGGLEIKAHATASAARAVFVNNHQSYEDIRSYNIRHIGHHRKKTDTLTKTADTIVLNNCAALYPKYNGVYPDTTPRALVVSAYRNVTINNFTAIGDDDFGKLASGKFDDNLPAIALQFMSANITLNNINIMDFKNAGADIQIYGGDNRGYRHVISNFNILNSSKKVGIQSGGGIYELKIINGNMKGNGTGNAIVAYNNTTEISGVSVDYYDYAAVIADEKYKVAPTVLKGPLSASTTGSAAVAEKSAVIASSGGTKAYSPRSFALGAGMSSKAMGSRSGVINSLSSETDRYSHAQTILNSRNVKSPGSYHIVAGYSDKGKPSTSNIKIDFNVLKGDLTLDGKLKQNNADIAEYFESQSGQAIDLGTIVTLDGDKIRKAQPSDRPIGVISGTAALIANDKTYQHKDRYLKNEYGVTITNRVQKEFIDDDGNSHFEWRDIPVENPDYDEKLDYVSREDRPEWNVVGLLGQIYTNVEQYVAPGDYISGRAGIGYKDDVNGVGRVMSITTPYTQERGYAIAKVLWGVKR